MTYRSLKLELNSRFLLSGFGLFLGMLRKLFRCWLFSFTCVNLYCIWTTPSLRRTERHRVCRDKSLTGGSVALVWKDFAGVTSRRKEAACAFICRSRGRGAFMFAVSFWTDIINNNPGKRKCFLYAFVMKSKHTACAEDKWQHCET